MDGNLVKIIVLGIIQGITEFLPISSSGHLVLFQDVMEMDEKQQVLVSVVLHGGSLVSIICYYFKDLLGLVRKGQFRVFGLLLAGTAPIIILYIPINAAMTAAESNPGILIWLAVAGFFISFVLLTIVYRKSDEISEITDISWGRAVVIGLMQLVAITPGVSRSGSTISMAGRLGISPETAAEFSFFLGIIAISGACVVKAKDVLALVGQETVEQTMSFFHLSVGFVVSCVVGYIALSLLIKVLEKGKLKYFGYYCLVMAIVTTIFAINKL